MTLFFYHFNYICSSYNLLFIGVYYILFGTIQRTGVVGVTLARLHELFNPSEGFMGLEREK